MRRKTMPRLVYLTPEDEARVCTSCPLPACIGEDQKQCPANVLNRRKRSVYQTAYLPQQKQARLEQRGYWPEIHGPQE